jgi:tetratricopeptide (TPR) repeat protein
MKLAELAAGLVVGDRYRLVRILGQGGYGDVWEAERLADRGVVALKFYHDSERAHEKLSQEADLARQFDHDNLVRVHTACPVEGLFCMEMELVPGVTLSRRLADVGREPITLTEAFGWMGQVAAGLAYLHGREAAVTHGDIKLDNLLLTPGGQVKIADFGLSRVEEADRFAPTDLGGTWLYMAPERLGLEQERGSCASDVYSFGVTFYRVLTGRFPRQTTAEVYTLTPIPRPCEVNSAIPAGLDDLLMRCLAKKPQDRYSDGRALLAALAAVQEGLGEAAACSVPSGVVPAPASGSSSPYALVERAYALAHEGQVAEAADLLNAALVRISTNPRLLEYAASLHARLGRNRLARQTYERALAWQAAHGVPVSDRRQAMERLGEILVAEKDYEAAVQTYHTLHESFPADSWLALRYGIALGLAGRQRDAIVLLEVVRQARPRSALVHATMGFAFLQLRDNEQAEQYFNEALMLDEFQPTALYHLALLRGIDGRMDRARLYYQRLCRLEGQEARTRQLATMLGLQARGGL